MNPDGTNPLRLTQTPEVLEGWMAWSPDSERLVFSAGNDAGGTDVFSVSVNGGTVSNLTQQGPHRNGGAKWSPDGSRIAFVSLRDGNAEIYVMNPDGSEQTNVTQTPDYDEGHLDWSPAGTRLAFVGSPKSGGNRDVFVMNADGTGRLNLSQSPDTEDLHPAWSPDGSKIAWDKYTDAPTGSLFVASPDGSDLLELAAVGTGPAWSPDGSLLAFTGQRTEAGKQYAEVFLIAPDGSGLQMLVTPEAPKGSTISSESDWRVVVQG
jgi:TolB protein